MLDCNFIVFLEQAIPKGLEHRTNADHPAVGLVLDTFHIFARGTDLSAIRAIPRDRIFLVQAADAPRLDMDYLSWSRHFRNFPGQGDFPLDDFMDALAATGFATGVNYADRTKDKVQPEGNLATIGNQYFQIDPQFLLSPTNVDYAGAGNALAWDVSGVLRQYYQPIVYGTPDKAGFDYLIGKNWSVDEKVTTAFLRGNLDREQDEDRDPERLPADAAFDAGEEPAPVHRSLRPFL